MAPPLRSPPISLTTSFRWAWIYTHFSTGRPWNTTCFGFLTPRTVMSCNFCFTTNSPSASICNLDSVPEKVTVLLGPGGSLAPSSRNAVPNALPSEDRVTRRENGPWRVSSTVYAGCACSRMAAPPRTWTLIWPRGAARVVLFSEVVLTASWVYQSRQIILPLPGNTAIRILALSWMNQKLQ